MSLREHLQSIYDQHSRLTPALVVDAARDEGHPLHPRFEWDDALAGPKYREIQAAELIRSIRVVYREATESAPERSTRQWVAPRAAEAPNVYEPADKVAADPLMRAMVLRQMDRDWQALKRQYQSFDEFWQLIRTDSDAA